MIFTFSVILCILSAITTIITFICYVRARMAGPGGFDGNEEEEDGPRRPEPGRKEKLYQSIHFITLFIFVVLGVLILIQLSNRLD